MKLATANELNNKNFLVTLECYFFLSPAKLHGKGLVKINWLKSMIKKLIKRLTLLWIDIGYLQKFFSSDLQ